MLFKRLTRGGTHAAALALALVAAPRRRLLAQMIRLGRSLPGRFDRPLPALLAELTPAPAVSTLPPADIRRLADAVAAWQWRSPLGLCLRRSLLRYYFLRQTGLPVVIVFGARLKSGREGGGIGGHAWLTLGGQPYHESPADYQGFTVMYSYPPQEKSEIENPKS